MTNVGRYAELMVQIELLRNKLGVIDGEVWGFLDTVPLWYVMNYEPVVQILREADMLRHFDGRTEADLYGWFSRHRTELADAYGEYDHLLDLAEILILKYEESPLDKASRQFRNLFGADELPPLKNEE